MKKYVFTIIVVALIIGGGILWWKTSDNNKEAKANNNTSNYQAERSSTNQNTENRNNSNTNLNSKTSTDENDNKNNQIESSNGTKTDEKQSNTSTSNEKTTGEKEIAQFSTKIYNKDSKRQNNITITCKTLSTKKIAPGETFSFCDTVGKATSAKGYQEADIYVNGEKKQGLGGGNCQVSTTLYNAVLKVPEFEIVERHQHSGKVPYIQSGKDAAVAYGAYDFKFKNNTGNTVRIVMENTASNITAKIIM